MDRQPLTLRRRAAAPTALAVVVAVVVAAVAAPARPSETAPSSSRLRVAHYQALPTFDPHRHVTFSASIVHWNVFERLVAFDAEGGLVPQLAARWEHLDANGDEERWRFHLVPGVRFHDGRPLEAADVAASLLRALRHPESRVANRLVSVADVVAVDATTVDVVVDQPDALFLPRLATVEIVPRDAPEEIVRPVGSGRYRWVEGGPAGPIVLAAVAEHRDGPPVIGRVELTVIEDPKARVAALLAGDVDLVTGLQPADLESIERRDDLWVDSVLGLKVFFVELSPSIPPLDDPRVRRAIDLAVDREEIVAAVYRHHARAASQLASPGTFGFDPGLAVTAPDPAQARELLAAAGHPDGVDLPFQYPENQEETAQLLAVQLARAGVRLELRPRSPSGYYATVRAERPASFFSGLGSAILDAAMNYESKVHSRSPDETWGRSNYTGFADPALDHLIESAAVEVDPTKREALLHTVARRTADHRVVLPLVWTMNLYGTRHTLDWTPRLDGALLFDGMRWRD